MNYDNISKEDCKRIFTEAFEKPVVVTDEVEQVAKSLFKSAVLRDMISEEMTDAIYDNFIPKYKQTSSYKRRQNRHNYIENYMKEHNEIPYRL